MDIEINYISLFGNYSYNIPSDICTICRESIYNKCLKCSLSSEESECNSVIGVCNHAYHYCCINNWNQGNSLNSKNCPLCNKEWKMQKK